VASLWLMATNDSNFVTWVELDQNVAEKNVTL
jgi:hypothetical protein